MTLLFLLVAVWLGISAGAMLFMAGVCSSGRVEDEARGYVRGVPGAAGVPAPRAAADDLVTV